MALLGSTPRWGTALSRTLAGTWRPLPTVHTAIRRCAGAARAAESGHGEDTGDDTPREVVGARVYRRMRAEHHRVFKWGIGNSFRSRGENRFTPVYKPHPTETVVRDDYYESESPNVVWEDLNECWEVYWYENSKLNARPFPVKKWGIERAKRQAYAFHDSLREANRIREPRKLDSPEPGVFFDARLQSWYTFFWRDGRPHSRGYAATKYGYEGAKMLAQAKRQDPVNGVIPIINLRGLRERSKQLAAHEQARQQLAMREKQLLAK